MGIEPLPRPTSYRRRGSGRLRKGKVVAEVYVDETHPQEGDYRRLIQLIQWADGEEFVRFCYYVKNRGAGEEHWRYGSQTTMQLRRRHARRLMQKALKSRIF